ncbi:MAG: GNAT family N-acetyltransferase [Planctomycetota bacterium]|nr:GNAT family N-acetyltransferase [Planctomycetota bacterium]
MNERVIIRAVRDSDLPEFFEQQKDPASNAMAGVATRDGEAFAAHWKMIRSDGSIHLRTIEVGATVAGHLVSWSVEDSRYIGYWIDRKLWGQGVASKGLAQFLGELHDRPLHAKISHDNAGSQRVLEKNGFVPLPVEAGDRKVRRFILRG